MTTDSHTDPCAVDAHPSDVPRWAGDADVRMCDGAIDLCIHTAVTVTRWYGIVTLSQDTIIKPDGTRECTASLEIDGDVEDQRIPAVDGYRLAAAVALLTDSYMRDRPEPDGDRIAGLANEIRTLLEGAGHAA